MSLSMEDVVAIQQVNAQYTIALDDLVADSASQWAQTFTPSGEFTLIAGDGTSVAVQARGTQQLIALQRSFPDPHSTRHWFNNIFIEQDGEGAKMTSYIAALIIKTTPAVIARTGIYRDVLVKTDGIWKFSERTLTLDPGSHL